MNAPDEMIHACSSCGRVNLAITRGEAARASHAGSCDADVAALMLEPHIAAQVDAWDCEHLRRALREFGCWTLEELDNHADNCARMVWVLAGNVADGSYEDERGEA